MQFICLATCAFGVLAVQTFGIGKNLWAADVFREFDKTLTDLGGDRDGYVTDKG